MERVRFNTTYGGNVPLSFCGSLNPIESASGFGGLRNFLMHGPLNNARACEN